MPLLAPLLAISGSMIARWVYSVLASLGIAFIAVQILKFVLQEAYERFQGFITQFPQLALELMGLCNVDLALNLIFTAYIWRMSVSVFMAKRMP